MHLVSFERWTSHEDWYHGMDENGIMIDITACQRARGHPTVSNGDHRYIPAKSMRDATKKQHRSSFLSSVDFYSILSTVKAHCCATATMTVGIRGKRHTLVWYPCD